MKLPNGYGSVSKVKRKNLRNKYLARVTVSIEIGQDGKKKQKKKSLGYYATKEEALKALTDYHDNQTYNVDYKNITFAELWKEWQEAKEVQGLKESTIKGYKFSYKLIPDHIKDSKFVNLTYNNLQNMINSLLEAKKGYQTVRKVKNSISQLYKYAMKNEIVGKNNAELLDIGKSPKKGQALIFSDEQISTLWDLTVCQKSEQTLLTVEIMLMLIFNGCRISEFLNLKVEDIYLDENYFFISDSKTEAGIRKVPIHRNLKNVYSKIVGTRTSGYFLLNPSTGKKFTYGNFRDSYFDQVIDRLSWDKNLTPHNCRKTCISLLTRAGVQPTYIKLIVGHEGALDLTEKVYTYVDVKELIDAINQI